MEEEILSDLGLIGLAVMGQNLVLNFSDKGYRLSVFNRSYEKTKTFLAGAAQGKKIQGYSDLSLFVSSLAKPRKIILLVKAGEGVSSTIEQLLPLLEEGDILIDGGNSYYRDTQAREKTLKEKGIRYIGMGVSGGEEGARHGPSLMVGGDPEVYPLIQPLLEPIAAHYQEQPCVAHVGPDGAGHYVKMVHNGIEYGDMQLIAESVELLRKSGKSLDELALIFEMWNQEGRPLQSFLIETMGKVLQFDHGFIDQVIDKAGQKGTGKWSVESGLELGVCVSMIAEAVFARSLSAGREERVALAATFGPIEKKVDPSQIPTVEEFESALYVAKIFSYTQGFLLLQKAAKNQGWELNYGNIASIWRGGCIIRSVFLDAITKAYQKSPDLATLLMDPFFKEAVLKGEQALRKVILFAVESAVAAPAFMAAIAFFDGYRTNRGSGYVIQALRDAFGSHLVELVGEEGKEVHVHWLDEKRD